MIGLATELVLRIFINEFVMLFLFFILLMMNYMTLALMMSRFLLCCLSDTRSLSAEFDCHGLLSLPLPLSNAP